jgi:hypothetical protein
MTGQKTLKPLRPQLDVHIQPSACTNCGKVLDGATAVQETVDSRKRKHVPKPGDFTVCIVCGHLMSFDEKLQLRDPTPEEQINVAGDRRLLAIMKAIAMAKAGMKESFDEITEALSRRRPAVDQTERGPGGEASGVSGADGQRQDVGRGDDRGGGTPQE